MTAGNIHSWESMGLVDGPGIRTVVFLQGCHLRCLYCHNPDTWSCTSSCHETMTAEEVVRRLQRFQPYYGEKGGVTFSGGEPLLQKDFLIDVLKKCKQTGIHTCLDTAGCGIGGYEEILSYTDLVLFDVKHYTEDGYRHITGRSPEESLAFLATAQKMQIPLWIRHVVVPGITDSATHLTGLGNYIRQIHGVQKVELLPYHTLGVSKYHTMHLPYPLEGVPPMNDEQLQEWQKKNKSNASHIHVRHKNRQEEKRHEY